MNKTREVKFHSLFSTPISMETLNFDTDEIYEECLRRKELGEGREISNVGGWQSNDLVPPDPFFEPFINQVVSSANAFADHISIKEVELSNIWINVNGPRDYNLRHDHGRSVFSGVFYPKPPKNSGSINFYHPISNIVSREWKEAIKDFTPETSQRWWYEPEDNLLILFPGFTEHEVGPNLSDSDRISISFNFNMKADAPRTLITVK